MVEIGGDLVGRTVAGRYELLRLIGEGGMGSVYAARHVFTKREVAVKLPHPFLVGSELVVQRFLRECQAPASIGHPAIVEVLDAGQDDAGRLYMVLELLEGYDLSQAMLAGRVDARALVAIAVEVLDALSAAHAAGFVHRDIKPENVFLCSSGPQRVRLLDFGVARALTSGEDDRLTRTGSVVGTPRYMSPEQIRGLPAAPGADVWAVGAVMYHALAGRPPFEATNYNLLVHAILSDPVPPLRQVRPDVPDALARVVDRALDRDPAGRWPDAGSMAMALQACGSIDLSTPFVSAANAPTQPSHPPTQPSHPPTRYTPAPVTVAPPPSTLRTVVLAALAAVLGGVVVAAAALALWATSSQDPPEGAVVATRAGPPPVAPLVVVAPDDAGPGREDAGLADAGRPDADLQRTTARDRARDRARVEAARAEREAKQRAEEVRVRLREISAQSGRCQSDCLRQSSRCMHVAAGDTAERSQCREIALRCRMDCHAAMVHDQGAAQRRRP